MLVRSLPLALVLVLTLAGCGGDDERPGSPTSSDQPIAGSQSAGISISDGVFGFFPDGTGSYESIIVQADDETRVIDALRRASGRFMLVTEDGIEHQSDDAVERSGLYSPNYVADPEMRPDGVRLYVDCKGVIEPAMAETFRQILREELAAAGIDRATVRPDLG